MSLLLDFDIPLSGQSPHQGQVMTRSGQMVKLAPPLELYFVVSCVCVCVQGTAIRGGGGRVMRMCGIVSLKPW